MLYNVLNISLDVSKDPVSISKPSPLPPPTVVEFDWSKASPEPPRFGYKRATVGKRKCFAASVFTILKTLSNLHMKKTQPSWCLNRLRHPCDLRDVYHWSRRT